MYVTPTMGPVTAGIGAVPVPGYHRPSHPRRHHPALPPDVDRFGIRAEHHPTDGGITGDPTQRLGGENLSRGGLVETPSLAGESRESGEDQHMGFLHPGRLPRVEEGTAQVGKAIGASLPGGAGIVGFGGWGGRPERGQDQVSVLGVEEPVQLEHAADGSGGVEITPGPVLLRLGIGARSVHRRFPIVHHPVGVDNRETFHRPDDHGFVQAELLDYPFPGLDDHLDLVGAQLAVL